MKTENGQKSTIGKTKQVNKKKTKGTQKKRELNIFHFFLRIKVLFDITLKDKLTQFWRKSFSDVLYSSTSS